MIFPHAMKSLWEITNHDLMLEPCATSQSNKWDSLQMVVEKNMVNPTLKTSLVLLFVQFSCLYNVFSKHMKILFKKSTTSLLDYWVSIDTVHRHSIADAISTHDWRFLVGMFALVFADTGIDVLRNIRGLQSGRARVNLTA